MTISDSNYRLPTIINRLPAKKCTCPLCGQVLYGHKSDDFNSKMQ